MLRGFQKYRDIHLYFQKLKMYYFPDDKEMKEKQK